VRDHDPSPEYANGLLNDLLKYYTLTQIEAQTGVSRRALSYMRHGGITRYPLQLAMEILAGRRVLKGT
jgi:hypothetical protein